MEQRGQLPFEGRLREHKRGANRLAAALDDVGVQKPLAGLQFVSDLVLTGRQLLVEPLAADVDSRVADRLASMSEHGLGTARTEDQADSSESVPDKLREDQREACWNDLWFVALQPNDPQQEFDVGASRLAGQVRSTGNGEAAQFTRLLRFRQHAFGKRGDQLPPEWVFFGNSSGRK